MTSVNLKIVKELRVCGDVRYLELTVTISVFTKMVALLFLNRKENFIPDDVQEDIDNLLENVPEVKAVFTVLNKIGSGKQFKYVPV